MRLVWHGVGSLTIRLDGAEELKLMRAIVGRYESMSMTDEEGMMRNLILEEIDTYESPKSRFEKSIEARLARRQEDLNEFHADQKRMIDEFCDRQNALISSVLEDVKRSVEEAKLPF